jgi:hypothetical protein
MADSSSWPNLWYRASILTAFAEAQALSLAKDLSRYSLTPSTTSGVAAAAG